jgi:hypothetical protein
MSRIIAILLANLFVVDYGVVPDGKGDSVYVIQIEPEVAKHLVEGYAIESVIPPELQGIRKFRIQIGNEELKKPVTLRLPVQEEGAIAPVADTSDDDGKDNEVPKDEATDVDVDSFPIINDNSANATDPLDLPLPSDSTIPSAQSADSDSLPLDAVPTQVLSPNVDSLVPEQIDTAELPGNPVEFDLDDKTVRVVLEPDDTSLPQLTQTPNVRESPEALIEPVESVIDGEVVGIPVFDKAESNEVAGIDAQTANVTLDLLDNIDSEDRIVLDALPDLRDSADESSLPAGSADNEPQLLEEDASKFVRLANASTGMKNVADRNSATKPTNTLSPRPRSWPLFSITLLGLLVSIGANVYLGMTVLDFYRKRQRMTSESAPASDPRSD